MPLSFVKKNKLSFDPSSVEGLSNLGREAGLEKQVGEIADTKPKLSFLQRLGAGLGAFNPAEAILTGVEEKSALKGVGKYFSGIGQGIGSAITGTDYQGERRYFSDVAKKLGIENGIAKFGLGFIGDVLLDPTSYFGGAIARGIGATAKGGTNLALKGIGKLAPETEAGLRMAGTGLQDALGRAFKFGYKSTEGAKEDILTFMSKESRAKLGLATSNMSRLGTGVLTKEQAEELALRMVAGKRAEFVAREVGKSVDEAGRLAKEAALGGASREVSGVIESQMARTGKFGEIIGLENPYEVYFPFIKKDKLTKFINETRGIRVGSEGYRKQFKNLLTNESIELDPAKAFFTREAQIVTDRMTRDFLNNFVKKYGKGLGEFNNVDEAMKNGYVLLKEKGNFGRELGYVSKYDGALIRDSLSPEFKTIDILAKATGFDAITSLFKRSVTGLFAPFHIRNYMSGMIQNYERIGAQALNPKNIIVGQKIAYLMAKGKKIPSGTIDIAGKTMKFDDVMKPFMERFSGDTFYTADFLAATKGGELKQVAKTFSKQRVKETAKTLGLGQEAIPFKIGRAVGQFIEHQQKATAYIGSLAQGKTIQEALKLAEAAGFDYRAITRFESQIMRRIIPFYSFARKNIGLQLSTLGENPQRINQVMRFFGSIGDTPSEEEKANLPDFIRESLGVKLKDTPEGLKQYISTFGTPIEAFTQLFGQNPILRAISMMNPLLKAPVEIGIGKDSFRQRDLKDVYNAYEYKFAPQIIKDLLEIKEIKKPVYKTVNGKPKIVGEKSVYVADPVKLLVARSLFTSRGVSYLDQVFGNDLQGFIKLLKTTTGVKPQTVDIEQQKYFNELDKRRALEDLLTKYGVTKQFINTYVPK